MARNNHKGKMSASEAGQKGGKAAAREQGKGEYSDDRNRRND